MNINAPKWSKIWTKNMIVYKNSYGIQKWKYAKNVLALSHPRCRWVCFFTGTYSPMDPLQWMGAVRTRVQPADKNITIIPKNPHDSSLSVNILWSEKLHVCNKQIHQDVFNLKSLLPARSPLSFILFSPSCLIWIRREIRTDQTFYNENNPKQF